jgi:LysM repeat protein
MSHSRYLALAAAAATLSSCTLFKKGEENYDTAGGEAAYDTSNPYGVPGDASAESVPYQPVNPPADNPTYSQAAYEENTASPATPAAPSHPPASAASAPAASTTHTVVRGDTLSGIARKYGVTTAAIKQANGMTSDTVVLGKQLAIPGASGPVAKSAPAAGGKTHTVAKGDTLAKISRKYGVSIDAIKKANGMSSDTVVLGSKLRIP